VSFYIGEKYFFNLKTCHAINSAVKLAIVGLAPGVVVVNSKVVGLAPGNKILYPDKKLI
jgi:hypothetical protein